MNKQPTIDLVTDPAGEAIANYMTRKTDDPRRVISELAALGISPTEVRSVLIYEFRVRWPGGDGRLKSLLSALFEAGLVDSDELS